MSNQHIKQKDLEKSWKDPSSSSAFQGLAAFARSKSVKDLKQLEKQLSEIEAFSRHRYTRTKAKRVPIILKRQYELIQADLADVSKFKYVNRHYSWIFVSICVFSKLGFCIGLKNKGELEVIRALKEMCTFYNNKIENLQTDREKAFYGKKVQAFLKSRHINHYSSFSRLKSQTVERFIRTLKGYLYKHFTDSKRNEWITVLPQIVNNYNNSVHSSHNHIPAQIGPHNEDDVLTELYKRFALQKRQIPKYTVGQYVRISEKRLAFHKSYKAGYSKEIFQISRINTTHPTVSYKLIDLSGSELDGSYVSKDLSLAAKPVKHVESK